MYYDAQTTYLFGVQLHDCIVYPYKLPCKFIENLYGKDVLIIPVDFTRGQQVYEEIAKQLTGLDIGILGTYLTRSTLEAKGN